MKTNFKSKLQYWTKNPKSDSILLIVLLLLINLVSSKAFFRIDLTSQKNFTLSKASQQLVKTIEQPLSINVFFTDDLPSPQSEVRQYLGDLLNEYDGYGNKNFSYKFFDMTKEENQTLATNYGLHQTQVQKVEASEVAFRAAWMSLVITYGDSIKVLDPVSSTDALEYKITTSISKMISTADAIENLSDNDEILLTLYCGKNIADTKIQGTNEIESAVKKAYDAINAKNLNRIQYRVIDAEKINTQETANEWGIQTFSYNDENQNEIQSGLGLVLSHKDDFVTIPLALQQTPFGWTVAGLNTLEESLAEGLQSLIYRNTAIGYIVGHGEKELHGATYNQSAYYDSSNMNTLLSDIYTLNEINLQTDNIPANISLIIINGPQGSYSEEELYKIDQFIMKGGNVLFFMDSLLEIDNGQNQMPSYVPPTTGLEKLFESYGITPGANYVMDKNCFNTVQQGQKIETHWAPLLERDSLSKSNVITKNLGYMIFLQNGSIDIKDMPDVKTTVLAKSSENSWTKSEEIILYPPYIIPPEDESVYKAENLAVLLEGKFKSPFTEEPGKNTDSNNSGNSTSATNTNAVSADSKISSNNTITKGIRDAKIIFVSSSAVTTGQLIDPEGVQPMSLFVHNAVDYLNDIPDYCEMRTKGQVLDLMTVRNKKAATFAKFFNQIGLALLVVLIGFIVWKMRQIKRNAIQKHYNPNDPRDTKNNRSEK